MEKKLMMILVFFFQAEDGIRDRNVTGVQTCALPISSWTSVEPRIRSRASCDRRCSTRTRDPLEIAPSQTRSSSTRLGPRRPRLAGHSPPNSFARIAKRAAPADPRGGARFFKDEQA